MGTEVGYGTAAADLSRDIARKQAIEACSLGAGRTQYPVGGMIDSFTERLTNSTSVLSEIRREMDALADRIFGEQPPEPSRQTGAIASGTAYDRATTALELQVEAIELLRRACQRFAPLA